MDGFKRQKSDSKHSGSVLVPSSSWSFWINNLLLRLLCEYVWFCWLIINWGMGYSPFFRTIGFWGSLYVFQNYSSRNGETHRYNYPSYLILKEKIIKNTWNEGWNGDKLQASFSEFSEELWLELKSLIQWLYEISMNRSLNSLRRNMSWNQFKSVLLEFAWMFEGLWGTGLARIWGCLRWFSSPHLHRGGCLPIGFR